MLQIIHPQFIAISKESRAVSVALLLVTSNQELRVVIMSGERPAILIGKQECIAGITTIVNMGSFYLVETSKLLI